MQAVLIRLADWPRVSGAAARAASWPATGGFAPGAYRVVFTVDGDVVRVWNIGHRGGVYD